ncbi:Beta-1,2-xylosyltransferase 1 [Trichoderma lentiforme]|uniref:Beta-1,2-xylosyltransferase 1 n=1 Tax=Trichoderma lentiforme TaxID=1567552 RepID=A0A9P4XIK0_9HYPO|nr:Beta-1,2-xylosyltransferase 1 [Trichoderma lentiforme]
MRGAVSHTRAFICLSLSVFILSARYYTSASFERPVHLTIITLLSTGVWLLGSAYYWGLQADSPYLTVIANHKSSTDVINPTSAIVKYFRIGHEHFQHLHLSFPFLLCCIALRTLIYWGVIRTSQCSRSGLEAFLPLFSFIAVAIGPGFGLLHLQPNKRQSQWSMPSKSQIIFTFLAAVWPLFVISAEESSKIATGTVCPIGWGRFVSLTQLLKCVIDAVIISHTSHLARTATDDGIDISKFMGKLSLVAAGSILLLSFPSWLSDSEFLMAFTFRALDNGDFAVDGFFAMIGVLSALTLLPSVHPSCFALLIITATFMGLQIPVHKAIPLLSPVSYGELVKHTTLAIVLSVPLWYLVISIHHTGDSNASRRIFKGLIISVSGFALIALVVLAQLFFFGPPAMVLIDIAIKSLVSEASSEIFAWESQAAASKSLADAVNEYTKRYTLPPPPNFDKWYEFAKEHNSIVVDDFDQINNDLLPFWGMEPAHIRDLTIKLFNYGSSEMGGMRIRNGSVEQSPYIPGSHRWMTDSFQRMIEPFSKWLPDMDIAINLADECRMAVSFDYLEALKYFAQEKRGGVSNQMEENGWPSSVFSQFPWPQDFPEPLPRATEGRKDAIDPLFTNYIRRPMFYDFVAASCPRRSAVHNSRWWDWSNTCARCLRPHSLLTTSGAILADVSLAHDLCHQPDVAYLDGFLNSPSALVGTNLLFPIFSQARVGGFSDILIPSPWHFDDKSAFEEDSSVAWEDKANALFWRGSRSDGFSAHGRWPGFLRPRFVHEAYEKTVALQSSGIETPVHINVSFTGEISKCDGMDCAVELENYKQWGLVTMSNDSVVDQEASQLPPGVPFEEHWKFKHLMDMDGAGFSGRFLPFLQSRSLPYRAAFFRTWYDERIQAWHHYIPVDIRLGSGFWSILEFFSGGANDKDGEGPEIAKKIAEQGREWSQKALRKEDMQIYMFRLLLEWGRITHDERERLGFSITKGE